MRCSIFVAMVLALGLVSCSGGSGSSSSENSSVTTVSSSSESVTPSSSSLLSSSSSLASSSVTASSSSEVVISSSSSAQSSLAASSSIPSGAVLDDGLMGWATQHPAGAPTGGEGADGQSCTVTNITELVQCFSDLRKTTVPYTVYVKGTINGANEDGTGYTIAEIKGRKTTGMENTGNVSLIGIVENGQLPTLNAVWLKVSYVDNIIIRNLRVVAGLDTSLGSMEACSGDTDYCDWNVEADAVTMQTVIRAWIDHCEFTDGFDFNGVNPVKANYKYHDGLVDIKKASDYITISYSKFSNHDKTMLIGSSDSDAGDYRITFFRNQFQYIGQRAPRVRFGKVHLLNNYYDNQLHTAEQHKYYMSYAVGLGYSSQVYSDRKSVV